MADCYVLGFLYRPLLFALSWRWDCFLVEEEAEPPALSPVLAPLRERGGGFHREKQRSPLPTKKETGDSLLDGLLLCVVSMTPPDFFYPPPPPQPPPPTNPPPFSWPPLRGEEVIAILVQKNCVPCRRPPPVYVRSSCLGARTPLMRP